MTRNEKKTREAERRLTEESRRLHEQRLRLKEAGFSEVEIQRVIDPLECFHLQKKEELESQCGPSGDLTQ